jgi:proton glutamate symport protein
MATTPKANHAIWQFWCWALHWQIVVGMLAGIGFGVVMAQLGASWWVSDWVAPFGDIFVNSLKLIAIPLILASLIKGVSDLQDMSRLSSMGGRTIGLYLITTVIAVCLGLLVVNLMGPGRGLSEDLRGKLLGDEQNQAKVGQIGQTAQMQKEQGPLQPLVDVVPDNLIKAAGDNRNMLQIIFWALFFGTAMIMVPTEKVVGVKSFIDGFNEVILKMIDLIMLAAPVGVFALMAALIAETSDWQVILALVKYALAVILGLALMILVVYPLLVVWFAGVSYATFLRGILPAQLLAFTTSSSAATLPVTVECVEERLGVDSEVASFVLPIGATINMDGTSLYQAVAAVFIGQALGIELDFQQQLTIVATATLASIGSAAVPGAGMVMLVVVLAATGIPETGLALILAVDRILDMCRTMVNVTGDAAVSLVVGKSLGRVHTPTQI